MADLVFTLTAPYKTSYLAAAAGSVQATYAFKVTVGNASARLGALLTLPQVIDERTTGSQVQRLRPPLHVIFQVDPAAANPVWLTSDNVTAPVVGGPGVALTPGTIVKYENAGLHLLQTSSTEARHPVNAGTAFQLIATANTSLNVTFSD